ncbi:MAG: hypothetical protein IKZ88_05060 [Neisseriaceae bacterium]|nr:hypothetical protein [Neisseriaceae bacterium]
MKKKRRRVGQHNPPTAQQGGIKVVKIQSINAAGRLVGWQAHPTAD